MNTCEQSPNCTPGPPKFFTTTDKSPLLPGSPASKAVAPQIAGMSGSRTWRCSTSKIEALPIKLQAQTVGASDFPPAPHHQGQPDAHFTPEPHTLTPNPGPEIQADGSNCMQAQTEYHELVLYKSRLHIVNRVSQVLVQDLPFTRTTGVTGAVNPLGFVEDVSTGTLFIYTGG